MATKISKAVALEAIKGMDDVHCFLGQNPSMFIGADWSHKSLVELLDAAEKDGDEMNIAIAEHPIGHNLAVWCEKSNCYAYFDIKRARLEELLAKALGDIKTGNPNW